MRTTTYQPWTRAELDLITEHWPRGGMRFVAPLLPHRSHESLRGKAEKLGLRIAGRKLPERYQPSEFVDAAIRRAYQTGAPNLRNLERATGRGRGWLKWRASTMGLSVTNGGNHAPWSAAENALLQAGIDAGKSASAIHIKIKRAGYHRSLSACVTQIHKLGFSMHREWWTAMDVSRLFCVDSTVVARWIEQGWLAATKTSGPSRIDRPGEPSLWKITPQAVRAFMLSHPEKWNHRKMSKEIMLDVLIPKQFNRSATATSA